ncbi:hypothetical protein LCGC14_1860270 [marine sediment metagenome]|uniref:Uncharacterized protein n=1 Tax=marine sediment metagenome TaxID=412755 RepID=A0A0F9J6T9_9ZZZZ
MLRRWWNRWLVRLGLVHSDWYRGTFDESTGWHTAYRMRRYRHKDSTSNDWVETHRWHDTDDEVGEVNNDWWTTT